ncbi:hypothetical protein D9M69_492990 [compost metagenome]
MLGFQQGPDQLLAHGEHMAIGVLLGNKGMGDGRWREEEQRPFLTVLLLIEIDPHRPALHVVHLEEAVVAMHRHVAAEEIRQLSEGFVVHLGIGVTLVVDLANVDVGDGLPLCHGDRSPLPSHTFDDERRRRKA